MKYVKFSDEEKIKQFDEIAARFFNANFGRTSKSDLELLMFHFYIDKMISSNENEDGTIDYNKCSDYKISQDLGISQQKVRNLKVNNQLVYPIYYKWEKALATLTKNARYDKDTKKITLNIPDPNLYIEIQNFIEEHGAYIEKQLNSKVLQIRAEYYIDLILYLESEKSRKAIIKKLKNQFKDEGKEDGVFDDKNIGKTLIDSAVTMVSIVDTIQSIISPENCIAKALFALLTQNINP